MQKWRLLALAGLALGATTPAYADFMIDPNPTGEKLFIDNANKDVSSFVGIVGSNVSGPLVDITTVGNVDTGSGFSNITPAGGTLTSLTFTPKDGNLFSDFGFRGQLLAAGTVTVMLIVASALVAVTMMTSWTLLLTLTRAGLRNADRGQLAADHRPALRPHATCDYRAVCASLR